MLKGLIRGDVRRREGEKSSRRRRVPRVNLRDLPTPTTDKRQRMHVGKERDAVSVTLQCTQRRVCQQRGLVCTFCLRASGRLLGFCKVARTSFRRYPHPGKKVSRRIAATYTRIICMIGRPLVIVEQTHHGRSN